MILRYCQKGNLRNVINNKSLDFNFLEIITFFTHIAKGLKDIHDANIIHKDLHSGNILIRDDFFPYISDLGLCRPANENQNKKGDVYGVLPYMAPEVLRGQPYTKATDIYSFGIIMNEVVSGEIPYSNVSHDHSLAVSICFGLRRVVGILNQKIGQPLKNYTMY
jgi:serine/threonine protein kinase